MRLGLVIVLLFVYPFVANDYGFNFQSDFFSHFAYMFNHSSITHLLLNCFALFTIGSMLERFSFVGKQSFAIYFIGLSTAFIASYIHNIYAINTNGASGIVYALLGQYLAIVVHHKNVKIVSLKSLLMYWGCIAFALAIGFINTRTNAVLHLSSFGIGYILGYLYFVLINK